MKKTILTAGLAGVMSLATTACDVCAVYISSQARNETGSGIFAGAAEQFTHFAALQMDGEPVADPARQRLESSITQLLAGYHFSDRWTLQFALPLIHRSFTRPESGGIERGTESGPGDASLVGSFLVWRHDDETWAAHWRIHGGLKFPSGNTGRLQEELAETHAGENHAAEDASVGASEHDSDTGTGPSGIHGHDLALGSGSVDGLLGTSLFARWKRILFTADFQYAARSEGDYGYQFANDLVWSAGPGCFILMNHETTLALQAIVSGEHKGLDTLHGAPMDDTGITAVYFGPKIAFTWSSHLAADFALDLPLQIENTALQLVPDYRLRGGITWRF